MKILLLIVLITLPVLIWSVNVHLNEYGHIVYNEIAAEAADYYLDNGLYMIRFDNLILAGNAFFRTATGFLTLTTLEENVPTMLRLYDFQGELQLEREFRRVVNITFSQNRQYALFYNDRKCIRLDLENAELEVLPGNSIFSINNLGDPLVYNETSRMILYNNNIYDLPESPRGMIYYNNIPLIFTVDNLYQIDNNRLQIVRNFEYNYFESSIIDGVLYLVEKRNQSENYEFKLSKTIDLINFQDIEERCFNVVESRAHSPIPAPLNYDDINYPYNIGNSYGEIQLYGYTPYLHPGVDFLGDDNQEVYAVHTGFVKAFLSTGGDAYWRVAIADENTAEETEGYLYAHLNQSSVVVNVGDSVSTGDFLGTLYPWGFADFTHIHFARLQDTGTIWNGDWWTIDNPLIDVNNLIDITPPQFENSINDDLFAFRDLYGNYHDSQFLTGQFDIISKCHDICNSTWKIDIWDLEFSLHPLSDPDSTVYQKYAYAFDMPLDTYGNGNFDNMVLNTIYSRDATCYSNGNYDTRDYYHIITNSDGDSVFTANDAQQYFDSSLFADGEYLLKVTARDAMMNTASAEMQVTFYNGVSWENSELVPVPVTLNQNYPNPFNPLTTINYSLDVESEITLVIYNLKGQIVDVLVDKIQDAGKHEHFWNAGKNPSGIYLYKLKTPFGEFSRKMILAK